eukprot:4606948-Pyramimonas_sp.AAC.2
MELYSLGPWACPRFLLELFQDPGPKSWRPTVGGQGPSGPGAQRAPSTGGSGKHAHQTLKCDVRTT